MNEIKEVTGRQHLTAEELVGGHRDADDDFGPVRPSDLGAVREHASALGRVNYPKTVLPYNTPGAQKGSIPYCHGSVIPGRAHVGETVRMIRAPLSLGGILYCHACHTDGPPSVGTIAPRPLAPPPVPPVDRSPSRVPELEKALGAATLAAQHAETRHAAHVVEAGKRTSLVHEIARVAATGDAKAVTELAKAQSALDAHNALVSASAALVEESKTAVNSTQSALTAEHRRLESVEEQKALDVAAHALRECGVAARILTEKRGAAGKLLESILAARGKLGGLAVAELERELAVRVVQL